MKKLLILGANTETIPLVETAKSLSFFTVVTDPDPNAPAKKVADRGINIDGTDVKKLVEYCIQEEINGVLVGVADRLIEPYQKVCEQLNLPCYTNRYQCEVLTNKSKFNSLCKEYNLSTVPSITLYRDDFIDDIPSLTYPILIKPVDKNSGKGITVAYNKQELINGIKKAFDISTSDHILLEKYMTCDDIIINYTVINGEPMLSSIGDRYTTKEQGTTSQVCLGAVYPSKFLETFLLKENSKIVKMLKGINLQNAILTISAFVDEDSFHYYDPGFRLQGEAPNIHIDYVNKFDQKRFLIDIAMNTKEHSSFSNFNIDRTHNSTIWFLLKKGKISKIEGFEKIEKDPSVIHISKRFDEGNEVYEDLVGTEGQVLARIYISCKTREELKQKILEIQNTIKVLDETNNNQLLKGLILN